MHVIMHYMISQINITPVIIHYTKRNKNLEQIIIKSQHFCIAIYKCYMFFFCFKIVDLVLHSCCLSVVVDRVKNEIANRTLNNKAVAENIRNKLNQFTQQLMDLRDAMNEAVKNTANAVEANNMNEKRMEELQVFI